MGQSVGTLLANDKFLMGLVAGATGVGLASYMHGAQYCPALSSEAKIKKTGLKEYSVVYTDRATNLMSSPFQQVMRDISSSLKEVYQAEGTVLIPGSGTYAMECVARQFGRGKPCLVIRNGYFSFRWSDIFRRCQLPSSEVVLMARSTEDCKNPHFAPCPIDEVVASIRKEKPAVVFAPHVETSTGIILTDEYIKTVADAVHEVGGLFVLDCIASGTIWVDMKALDLDVVITAPQKGWTGPACVGIAMLSARALAAMEGVDPDASGSFCCNLSMWHTVMKKYEAGAFMYYTTLPTDALTTFRDAIMETKAHGFEQAKADLFTLGSRIRKALEKRGFKSVAPEGIKAPGVVVSYASDPAMVALFKEQGLQIAGGVPFKLNEPEGLITFRLGLFGLDKIKNIDKTVSILVSSIDNIMLKMKKDSKM